MHLHICYLRSTNHLGGLNICLVLSSEALLKVGWKGGFSFRNFYTHLLVRLKSAHLRFFVLKGASSNTLEFWKNIEVSTPFLGVPL